MAALRGEGGEGLRGDDHASDPEWAHRRPPSVLLSPRFASPAAAQAASSSPAIGDRPPPHRGRRALAERLLQVVLTAAATPFRRPLRRRRPLPPPRLLTMAGLAPACQVVPSPPSSGREAAERESERGARASQDGSVSQTARVRVRVYDMQAPGWTEFSLQGGGHQGPGQGAQWEGGGAEQGRPGTSGIGAPRLSSSK
jgi:hypothetical protein